MPLSAKAGKVYDNQQIGYSPLAESKAGGMETSEGKTTTTTRYWTSRRVIIIVAICSVQFCAYMSFAMLAPFFTGEARKRRVSETVAGLIFATMPGVQLLASPIIGKVLPLVGAKFLLLAGMYSASFCIILFGTLEYSPHGTTFAALCFLIRSVLAVSVAAFATASYSLLVREFPDRMGSVLGTIQTFVGLGLTAGPAIGGFLYSAGGFQLPFFVSGGITLVFAIFNTFMATQITDTTQTATGSFKRLLRVPGLIPITVCCVLAGDVWTVLDPTLEPRMHQYGLGPSQVGLLFLLLSASYSVLSLIVGRVSDRVQNPFFLSPIGLIVCGVGLLLLGPSRLLGFPDDYRELWLVLVALAIVGGADAFGTVPTFTALLRAALDSGMEDDIMTYSLVSGWWTGAFSLGDFIGPSLGALLADTYGFADGCTITAGMCIGLSILAIIYKCAARLLTSRSQHRTGAALPVDSDDEHTPIIRGNQVRPSFGEGSSV